MNTTNHSSPNSESTHHSRRRSKDPLTTTSASTTHSGKKRKASLVTTDRSNHEITQADDTTKIASTTTAPRQPPSTFDSKRPRKSAAIDPLAVFRQNALVHEESTTPVPPSNVPADKEIAPDHVVAVSKSKRRSSTVGAHLKNSKQSKNNKNSEPNVTNTGSSHKSGHKKGGNTIEPPTNSHLTSETDEPLSSLPGSVSTSQSHSKPKTASARRPARSKATLDATTTPTDAAAETTPQKRVLPPRRNMHRDAGVFSLDPTLLGLSQDTPLVPPGGYFLHVNSNPSILDSTIIDKERIPPVTYGATAPPVTPAPPAPGQPIYNAAAPAKPIVHIEVPIFKPCTIAQFLQDEKRRKMEALTKALAKAEAIAAAEAMAMAASQQPITPPAPGTRTMSTRQKHKETIGIQQVSVVTATPGGHGKKSTTVITTGPGGKGSSGTSVGGGHAGHHKKVLTVEDEDLHDEVYEKRHRKQEMAERRIKNREKEKLRHAMYQQQQIVGKLRHMDINRLMPISAFRTQSSTSTSLSQEEGHTGASTTVTDSGGGTRSGPGSHQISHAAARAMQEEYHRRLIREAEENLRRYQQLGLAGDTSTTLEEHSPFSRTINRLASWIPDNEPINLSPPVSSTPESRSSAPHTPRDRQHSEQRFHDHEPVRKKRIKTVEAALSDEEAYTTTEQRRRTKSVSSTPSIDMKTQSPTPSTSSTTSRKSFSIKHDPKTNDTPSQPPRPPQPITTFIKPGSIIPAGGRKSSRVALAFGEKVPLLTKRDFDLPMDDVFGPLLRARMGEVDATTIALPLRIQ
ncbi:hypothetical protein BGZ94_000225 [Podila epigama]|nr:hypothetical protein BGZ94_000225 [Podila epigama]